MLTETDLHTAALPPDDLVDHRRDVTSLTLRVQPERPSEASEGPDVIAG